MCYVSAQHASASQFARMLRGRIHHVLRWKTIHIFDTAVSSQFWAHFVISQVCSLPCRVSASADILFCDRLFSRAQEPLTDVALLIWVPRISHDYHLMFIRALFACRCGPIRQALNVCLDSP